MPLLLRAVLVLNAATSRCRCKQNKFCLPRPPCGRVSCRNTHVFKWDHSRLFFFQHWLISPAFCYIVKPAERNKYTRIFSSTKWEQVCTYFCRTAKILSLNFLFYSSLLIFHVSLLYIRNYNRICLLVPSTMCRVALKTKLYFFVFHTSQTARKTLDFQLLAIQICSPRGRGEFCVQLWWLCSASVGAVCAGELIFERLRDVTQEMSLVCWDKQGCSPTLEHGWLGSTHSLSSRIQEFLKRVKARSREALSWVSCF